MTKLKIQTRDEKGDLHIIDWSVNILRNDMKMPAGLVLITLNN